MQIIKKQILEAREQQGRLKSKYEEFLRKKNDITDEYNNRTNEYRFVGKAELIEYTETIGKSSVDYYNELFNNEKRLL